MNYTLLDKLGFCAVFAAMLILNGLALFWFTNLFILKGTAAFNALFMAVAPLVMLWITKGKPTDKEIIDSLNKELKK